MRTIFATNQMRKLDVFVQQCNCKNTNGFSRHYRYNCFCHGNRYSALLLK